MPESSAQAQAVRHRRVGQRLVFGELGLVQRRAGARRDDLRVGAEEELEQAGVAQLGELGRRLGEPRVERLAARRR